MAMTDQDARRARHPDETAKQTIIVVIVALVVAFMFRAFVIEPFVIPTGSMAPTLLGAHTRQWSQQTGRSWAVDIRDPMEGPMRDPWTQRPIEDVSLRARAGDRILVLKYLSGLAPPRRWDVAVFRSPEEPEQNFIKRLVGLPGEDLWLVDGDVFTRRRPSGGEEPALWRVQRKPAPVQDALWRTIYSTDRAPRDDARFRGPWTGLGWDRLEGGALRFGRSTSGALVWDDDSTLDAPGTPRDGDPLWPIDDWTPYNRDQVEPSRFPVSDLRMSAQVEPEAAGLTIEAVIEARAHVFRAVIGADGRVALHMQPDRASPADRTQVATGRIDPLAPNARTRVTFEHVDQTLRLRIGDEVVLEHAYDWGPQRRLTHATRPVREGRRRLPLAEPARYRPPSVRWLVDGAPVTLRRVGLDRDAYYQPRLPLASPARGVERPISLGPDDFFVLGDNSAASKDSRVWTEVDPWLFPGGLPEPGVVPRRLLIGRAFFVYFPAPHEGLRGLPIPDFGRMRFIR